MPERIDAVEPCRPPAGLRAEFSTVSFSRVARTLWPDDHLALHLIHALEVRAISQGRPLTSTCLTRAEGARVRELLANLEAAG